MRRGLCVALLVALLIMPGLGVTEGSDTVQLARTMYALGRDEPYETLLMIGSVVMNRVESPWYPDTVNEVLGEPHQFPHGLLYNEECMRAAREIMMGRRVLPRDVVLVAGEDASYLPRGAQLYARAGEYGFYAVEAARD